MRDESNDNETQMDVVVTVADDNVVNVGNHHHHHHHNDTSSNDFRRSPPASALERRSNASVQGGGGAPIYEAHSFSDSHQQHANINNQSGQPYHHHHQHHPTPRRTQSMISPNNNNNNNINNNENERFPSIRDEIRDYSDRGIGARPLGFLAVAQVRKLEKKERSSRRLLLTKNQSSTSSIVGTTSFRSINEQTPLKSAAGGGDASATAEPRESLDRHSFSSDIYYHDNHGSQSPSGKLFDPDNDVDIDGVEETPWNVLKNIIFGKTISVLLILMPVAWWAQHRHWSPEWIFWLCFAVMVPLASILSDFTEEVAAHTNQTLGGLINATFGNAVEVLVGIQALLSNEIRIVQASMLGSIFSNLLLVLGSCFFFGGLYHKEQHFNSTAATANMGLLALSSIALVLPTPFAEYYKVQDEHVLTISRVAAIFLIFMYVQLLVFQLKTHAHLFEDDGSDIASIPMWMAMSGLLIATLLIAYFSEFLVQSIDGFCESSGISRTFVGLIILPIVGNAVEHVAAVTVAMKDKMDLAMGVAVGSCTQISLFVTPLIVLIGWGLDRNMTLNFPHFEIILYVMSVVTVSICLSNPKGNWLEGSLLITTYLMIAAGFWFEKVVDF